MKNFPLRRSAFNVFITGAAVALAAAGLTTAPALAATYTWQNTDPDFTDTAAWSEGGPPANIVDLAQFTTLGTFAGKRVDPELNAAVNTRLWFGNTALGGGYTLRGNGTATGGDGTVGGLVTRGIANTTISLGNGTANSLTLNGSSISPALDIGYGSTLTLSGNTIATAGYTVIRGTLVLDNSAGNPNGGNSQRLTPAQSSFFMSGGGSALEFKSASGGSTFNGIGGPLNIQTGFGTVRLNQTDASGPLEVNSNSLFIANGATVNFVNVGTGTLGGGSANDPTIKFTTAPSLSNGVISGSGSTPGRAIFNGTDFASYDATRGIIAATSTAVSGSLTSSASQNSNLTDNATVAGSTTVTYNTLKIAPTAAGQSLALGTNGNFTASATLLAGSTSYAITGASSSRFMTGTVGGNIFVTDPNAVLSIATNVGLAAGGSSSGFTLTKGGDGFLWLNGTANQVSYSAFSPMFTLGAGVLRVNSASFNLTTARAPVVQFRGGTLEYDVSSAAFTFSRSLGGSAGNVNWQLSTITNSGSGGFSAYAGNSNGGEGNGNALRVNLGGANATLTWGATPSFVRDGGALRFGSVKSNSTVIWQNPLALDGGTPGDYAIRQIDVTRGVGNAADKTQLAGVVSGSSSTDLVKTGNGTLEFTANNTYSGHTLVAGGRLALSGAGAVAGNVTVLAGATFDASSLGGYTVPAGRFFTTNGTLTVGTANLLTVNGSLSGAGEVTGNVSLVGGTLAPGVGGPGVLTITGNLSLDATSAIRLEVNGPDRGTDFDVVSVTGGIALGGALNFYLPVVSLEAPIRFGTYKVFDFGTAPTRNLDAVSIFHAGSEQPQMLTQAGNDWSVTVGATTYAFNQTTGVFTVVPEPTEVAGGTVALLLAMAVWRRLRRRPSP